MKRNTGKKTRKDTLDGVTKDNPEQSRRFVETAKELGADKANEGFEAVISSITSSRKAGRHSG